MEPKLICLASHEVENHLELSLRQAFKILEPKLRPPFPVAIPDTQEYHQLNRALVYGILCESDFAKTHVKHLHARVTDGYALFSSLVVGVVNELYRKLLGSAKNQLMWVTKEMIDVSAVGTEGMVVSLLRRTCDGDYGDENVWLCSELVNLFLHKWDCLLEDEPLVLTSALYTFLRLLEDHSRLPGNVKLENVKKLEIKFCVKMLREQFHLCLKIGRDLIRLLQDLIHVPELKEIWKDLVSSPDSFRSPGFSDISQIYRSKTSSRYFLLRISPEMETQLRFLLTFVKLGCQKRHQTWFWKKFLSGPERETLLIDIVRFICCAHHPSNEIIQSDIIPRWAVIGWLLKLCRNIYIDGSVKLALFYDWLFFDERFDNIMNIEPGILLMVCSIPQYMDIAQSLLGFLLHLVDHYDKSRRDMIVRCVSSSFREIVRKGVLSSLDVLTSCPALAPFLKEKLEKLLSCPKERLPQNLLSVNVPSGFPGEQHPSRAEGKEHGTGEVDILVPMLDDSHLSHSSSVLNKESQADCVESLVGSLGESLKKSGDMGFQSLENILVSFIHLGNQREASGLVSPEELSSRITREYEMSGYKLFAPLQLQVDASTFDDEIGSATASVIRRFILSLNNRVLQMLLFWLQNGYQVGARVLSYVARLAFEARMTGCLEDGADESTPMKISDPASRLLRFHIDGYLSSLGETATHPEAGRKYVSKLVENAFSAYSSFCRNAESMLKKEVDISLSKLLFADLKSCCEWGRKSLKYLFSGTFIHLPNLCSGDEQIIRLLVGQLDHADLVSFHLEIRLKKFSVFGRDTDAIFNVIKKTSCWDCMEQHKLWGLIRSELAVSSFQVEKVVSNFFSCHELAENAIAVEGLLALLSSRAPTPELVSTIVLLPNTILQDFASSVLSTWAVSNPSMLFESFAKSLEKLENSRKDLILSDSSGIVLNHSAICWLLNYFSSKGMDVSDVLRCFSADVP